jgi:hypothetical protein
MTRRFRWMMLGVLLAALGLMAGPASAACWTTCCGYIVVPCDYDCWQACDGPLLADPAPGWKVANGPMSMAATSPSPTPSVSLVATGRAGGGDLSCLFSQPSPSR